MTVPVLGPYGVPAMFLSPQPADFEVTYTAVCPCHGEDCEWHVVAKFRSESGAIKADYTYDVRCLLGS